MSDLFLLSERQMGRLSPHFPLAHGVPRVDDRRVVSGIVNVIRNGLQWKDAPKGYGPHKTLYNRFIRWSRLGVFDKIFVALSQDGRRPERLGMARSSSHQTILCALAIGSWCASPSLAAAGPPPMEMCVPGRHRTAHETCLVAGDTLWLEGQKLHLKDYDTPEPQPHICGGGEQEIALAHRASQRLLQILNSNEWTVETYGKEQNGSGRRTLATIFVNGKDVGDFLIAEHLARHWPDGLEWWCTNN